MRAALLVCALSDGAPAAAQTAEVPQAPGPAAPSTADPGRGLRWPTGWLGVADDTRQPPAEITIAAPGAPGPVQLPRGWTFRFDAPATCPTCGDRLGPGVVNGNTPWRVSGALDWQSDAGALGVRVTGQRGARLPVYMTPPAAGMRMPVAASDVTLSDARTHWQVTLSGERTLWRSPRGRSLSLFGDLHLPLGTRGPSPATDDVPTLSQTAFLGGFKVRW